MAVEVRIPMDLWEEDEEGVIVIDDLHGSPAELLRRSSGSGR